MSSLLETVEEIIELLDVSILPIDKLGVTFERLRDLLADSMKRRAERQLRRNAEDFDEEEAEALEVKMSFRSATSPQASIPILPPPLRHEPGCRRLFGCQLHESHSDILVQTAGDQGRRSSGQRKAVRQLKDCVSCAEE